jgi:hypothetical protein
VDVSRPDDPQFVTVAGFDAGTEGNTHSLAVDDERGLLISTDEDLFPSDTTRHVAGWGSQQIYEVSDSGLLEQVATFASGGPELADADAVTDIRRDGYYSAHEAVIADGVEYVAWYSGGMRIVDIGDPAAPVEIGFFIPPPAPDPTGHWKAPDGTRAFPLVWGVEVVEDLIFMSDVNTGLWIARFDDGLSEEMTLPPGVEPVPGGPGWPPVK